MYRLEADARAAYRAEAKFVGIHLFNSIDYSFWSNADRYEQIIATSVASSHFIICTFPVPKFCRVCQLLLSGQLGILFEIEIPVIQSDKFVYLLKAGWTSELVADIGFFCYWRKKGVEIEPSLALSLSG